MRSLYLAVRNLAQSQCVGTGRLAPPPPHNHILPKQEGNRKYRIYKLFLVNSY